MKNWDYYDDIGMKSIGDLFGIVFEFCLCLKNDFFLFENDFGQEFCLSS